MSIKWKINLIFVAIVITSLLTIAVSSHFHVKQQIIKEAYQKAEIISSFTMAARSYTVKTMRPLVQEIVGPGKYHPELMGGFFVARAIADIFSEDQPGYSFKHATLNPINPQNQANQQESEIITFFSKTRSAKVKKGTLNRNGEAYIFVAKPVVVQKNCLRCHGIKEKAPKDRILKYSGNGGYNYRLDSVVATFITYVPVQRALVQLNSRTVKIAIVGICGVLFVSIILWFFIGNIVTQPIIKLSRLANDIRQRKRINQQDLIKSFDEIGTLYQNIVKAEKELRDARKRLEQRMAERTDELVRINEQLTKEIEERRQAEESLQEKSLYLDSIIRSSSSIAIAATDLDFRIRYYNSEAERIFGYSAEEVINKTVMEMHTKEKVEPSRFEKAIEEVRDKGLYTYSLELETVNGIRYIDSRVTAIRDTDNNLIGFVLTAQDVTEEKKTEKELLKIKKLESLGVLAGGLAHDFNNTLTALFGNISIAKMKLSNDHPAFKSLEGAENAMDRATRLTTQLLTFAKGGEPVREDVSLGEIVKEVTRFDLSGSNVMPVFEHADDLWIAKVDKGQVQQVFSNLTMNANQAMPDGGRLYIKLENADISKNAALNLDPGKYIKITVRDEGIGIDQKYLDRIFDPYFSTKQAGSGLGLATVYSIINKHGGHISADSELGKGTTFTLYLPASESRRLPETKQPGAEPSTLGQTTKILVMDDEEMLREAIAEMLEISGFSVETAIGGEQAIEMYKQSMDAGEPFDIVIMDLTVPGGMGGKEAVKELLTIDSEAKAIVSSGYSTDPVMANYSEYGFKGRLLKPFQMEDLKKELTSIMEIG